MVYKTIDLFAGIGGIRRGFEMTGKFKNVMAAEIDKYACIMYKHIFGDDPKNDVTSEQFKKQVQEINYDVLLAGFPCQSFSRAGKQKGFLDKTRGTLFFDIADIINRTRPKAFLLENVDNLISHDKGKTFKVILETLVNDLDYKIVGVEKNLLGDLIYSKESFIRNSRNFGIPQNRPRVYIMGFDNKKYNKSMHRIVGKELPKQRKGEAIYEDLNDILEYGNKAKYYISQGYLETLKEHKKRHMKKGNGFGYVIVNSSEIDKPYSNALLATGGSGKERNLVYDKQEGIAGKIVKNKKTPLNSECIRYMTPREWGKLQGFIGYAFINEEGEDTFTLPDNISDTQLYKQFGNSVTIPVIEELALFMYECLVSLE